ncbi:olfactory receptor 2A12-like [Suncus etruscus]|uniref:olfactory receptor 2A12-like n=1 Tax=Suncus etruscus TaxID=109475 RepID=UPI002110BE3B|nr:olfactory receptor 2A12-like [Suncus etruscus]
MGSNQTWITEVILLGFQFDPEVETFLFGLFLLFYSLTLMGNGLILGLIILDSRLHTPMYFFLSNLAIVDMSFASSIVPKMLEILIAHKTTMSFVPCILQTLLYLTFAITECTSLVVMSYDRYVAICHPLHYSVIMSWKVCTVLTAFCWVFSFLTALVHVSLLLRLPFCGPQTINHFFCQLLALIKLTCGDTRINKIVLIVGSMLVLVVPLCLVLVSYTHILIAILKIQSKEGRKKAFSTCSSHLCVVGLFFINAIILYMTPKFIQSEKQKKILSLFYCLFNPMLNPLIYSLRNSEVKGALRRVLKRKRAVWN